MMMRILRRSVSINSAEDAHLTTEGSLTAAPLIAASQRLAVGPVTRH